MGIREDRRAAALRTFVSRGMLCLEVLEVWKREPGPSGVPFFTEEECAAIDAAHAALRSVRLKVEQHLRR